MPGWDRFDVAGYVERRFPVPALVDNDVNILALGEHALSWPHADDLIFVKVATGLGAGIITGGRLQRGAQGIAGDIGHVQVPFSRDSPRPPEDERTLANPRERPGDRNGTQGARTRRSHTGTWSAWCRRASVPSRRPARPDASRRSPVNARQHAQPRGDRHRRKHRPSRRAPPGRSEKWSTADRSLWRRRTCSSCRRKAASERACWEPRFWSPNTCCHRAPSRRVLRKRDRPLLDIARPMIRPVV